jgi:hypothetical protein
MRTALPVVAILLGLSVTATQGAPEAERSPADRIARLIRQLGSSRFVDRDAATRALDVVGAPALEALKKASRGEDPEIGRRAEELAARIERRLETARLLEPKHVRLSFVDTPVPDAVAELKRQSGYSLQVTGDPGRLAGRKITLDTGSVPFWRALELFCQKAGLSERGSLLPGTPEWRVGMEVNAVQARRLTQRSGYAGLGDGFFSLVDVRPTPRPTCVTGAVRFQVVPANNTWAAARGPREMLLVLEMTAEPRLTWQGALDIRVEKAVDDNGQLLTPVPVPLPAINNEVDIRLVLEGDLLRTESASQVPVRLRQGERPSKELRELRGTVTAQVLAPPEALLTIEDVLRAGGHTFKGTDGASVQVLEAGRQANGPYRLRLQLDGLPRGLMLRGPGIIRVNGAARLLANPAATTSSTWALQNAEGREFRCAAFETTLVANGGGIGQELRLTYEPDPNLGEPAKLVQKGRRTVVLDVPFALENVPVP